MTSPTQLYLSVRGGRWLGPRLFVFPNQRVDQSDWVSPTRKLQQQRRGREAVDIMGAMDGLTWEEKYLRLRDDHTSLTHKANGQDDIIRRWEGDG